MRERDTLAGLHEYVFRAVGVPFETSKPIGLALAIVSVGHGDGERQKLVQTVSGRAVYPEMDLRQGAVGGANAGQLPGIYRKAVDSQVSIVRPSRGTHKS
jgi:hypothetical protein